MKVIYHDDSLHYFSIDLNNSADMKFANATEKAFGANAINEDFECITTTITAING